MHGNGKRERERETGQSEVCEHDRDAQCDHDRDAQHEHRRVAEQFAITSIEFH